MVLKVGFEAVEGDIPADRMPLFDTVISETVADFQVCIVQVAEIAFDGTQGHEVRVGSP
jgi:hypothetical protein